MIKASVKKHTLRFNTPGGTSRGVLTEKDSYFLYLWDEAQPQVVGVGECSVIPRLSYDDKPDLCHVLANAAADIHHLADGAYHTKYEQWPSVRFAIETALLDWRTGGVGTLFPSRFAQGEDVIPINGLLWMGAFDYMWTQAEEKFRAGFSVLKMKVGALNFDEELYFVKKLRQAFPHITLRLDANCGFPKEEALERLCALSEYAIHSIEQPIVTGCYAEMAHLCKKSPIPIALDEELIGLFSVEKKKKMLSAIAPAYIILKPSLVGGFSASDEWIRLAEAQGIGWWATSALESNIGLNAIAQWVYTKHNLLPQGLGTGGVFSNNIPSSLVVENGCLCRKTNQ